MNDGNRTKAQLLSELKQLRSRIGKIEKADSHYNLAEDEKACILNLSTDLICIAGMDGYFKYVNPAWQKLLGYSAKELLSRPFLDFIHPDDHNKNDSEVEKLAEGKITLDFENRYIHKNGSIRLISWIAAPMQGKYMMYCIGRDITPCNEMDKKLHINERRLAALMKNLPGMAYRCLNKPGWPMLFVSQGSIKLTGYTPDELTSKTKVLYGEIIHPDDREKVWQKVQQAVQNKKPFEMEYGITAKNGEERWVWERGQAVNINGDMPVLEGFISDITAIKMASQELRKSEALKNSIIESSHDCIKLLDTAGNLLFINKSGRELLKIDDMKSYLNCSWVDFWKDKDRNAALKAVKSAAKGGIGKFQGYCPTAKKTPKWWDIIITPIKDSNGKVENLLAVSRDITERRQAEEALRESELRFKQISENAQELIWEVDNNGLYTYISPVIKDLLGYEAEEVIGIKYFYDFFDPENKEEKKQAALGMFARKEDFRNFINSNIHKDGRKIILSTSGIPILDMENNPIGYRGVDIDITERIRAEELLKSSEKNYRELIDGMNETVWVISYNGDLIDVNKTAVEVLGYSKEELFSIGLYGIDSSMKKEDIQALAKAMSSDKVQIFETSHKTKDGITFPVEIYSSLVTYQGEKAILSIARNITGRKQAELEIINKEKELRLVTESSLDTIFTMTKTGTFLYISPAVKDLIGYEPKEIIGTSLTKYVPKKELTRCFQILKDVFINKKIVQNFETYVKHRDGRLIPVDISGQLIKREDRWIAQGTIRNITERKQAEQALLENETKYRTLVTKSPDGIFIADLKGNFLSVNQAMCENLKYTKKEFLSMKLSKIILQQYVPLHQKRLQAIINGESKQEAAAYEVKAKDGRVRFIEVLSAPYYKDENIIGFQGIARDITERNLAEAAIKTQLEELQRWHKAMLRREDRILGLKREVNEVLGKTGQPPRYLTVESEK